MYLSRADKIGRTSILGKIGYLRHWRFHEWREITLNSFEGPVQFYQGAQMDTKLG